MIRFLKENNDNNLYQQLLDFAEGKCKGKDIEDNLIYEVRNNGIVVINFDSISEFLELFEDSMDSHDKYMIEAAFSRYSNYEFFDYYRGGDDWNEGYILKYCTGESETILKRILSVLAPSLIDPLFNQDKDEAWKSASDILDKTFSSEVNDIISDYSSNMNDGANDWIIDEATKDLCNFFEDIQFIKIGGCFRKYYTTVKSLIQLYKITEAYQDDLKGALTKYVEHVGFNENYNDGLYDNMYNFFDDSRFNTDLQKNLESMLEKLEDSDIIVDINEYKKMTALLSKFGIHQWHDIPKDKTLEFFIDRINPENNLIVLKIRNKNNRHTINYQVDFEQLNLILFQPELFNKFND